MPQANPDHPAPVASAVPQGQNRPVPHIPDHTLLRCIGRGSYGEVWLGRNVMGTYRAVKIVYRDSFADERPYEREFGGIQKYEPLSRRHEGLMDILQIGRKDKEGFFYYVMELADDQRTGQVIEPATYAPRTLRSELEARGPLPVLECLRLGQSLSAALGFLHQHGLIHRDVKPSNIIFVNGIAQLADIGLVAGASEARSFVGTVGFIPPEGPGTVQAGIYSLGKVFYEMSTGKDRQEFPELPTALGASAEPLQLVEFNEVVLRACESDLRTRYETAEALHADLLLLQSGKSLSRLRKVERRLALCVRVGMAALAVAVIALGAYLYQVREARKAIEISEREAGLRQEAEAERRSAEQERDRAEQLTEQVRQTLYATRVNLAAQLFQEGDSVRAVGLLESVMPQPGETDLRGFEWFYLWRLCHSERLTLHHADVVRSVAFSPDNRVLASAGNDMVARLWDADSGKELHVLVGHTDWISSVAFSPDGKLLATGSADRSVKLWNTASGAPLGSWQAHTNPVSALAFSADGKWLASATAELARGTGTSLTRIVPRGDPGEAKIWEAASGMEKAVLKGHRAGILSLAFSPDGGLLASAGSDQTVRLYDTQSGEESAVLTGFAAPVFAVAFSPDGSKLLTGGGFPYRSRGEIRLFDVKTRRELPFLKELTGPVTSLAFAPHGDSFASVGLDQLMRIWDMSAGAATATYKGHTRFIWTVAFSQDGKQLASGGWDSVVKVWDPARLQEYDVLKVHDSVAYSLAYTPDGKFLVSGSRYVDVWDPVEGKQLRRLPDYQEGDTLVAFSPNGKTLAAGGVSGVVHLWQTGSWRSKAVRLQHPLQVWSLAFAPDSRTLATGEDRGTIRFWDIETGREEGTLLGHGSTVATLAFSPDGMTLLSGSPRELKIWNLKTRQCRLTLVEPTSRLRLSPDGRILASGAAQQPITLRDFATMQKIGTLSGHRDAIYSMTFSPDSKTLVTTSWDCTAKLWNVAAAQELITVKSPFGVIWNAAFSPDGTTLALGSGSSPDGNIALLRTATSEEVNQRLGPRPAVSNPAPAYVRSLLQIPPRDPAAGPEILDLGRQFNASLTAGWIPRSPFGTTAERNFGDLPLGLQVFGGITFEVRGLIQLGGGSLTYLGAKFPKSVEGIPVNRRCQQIHFLHGTGWTVQDGIRIGQYFVNYRDGKRQEIPIDYGLDVRDWNLGKPENRQTANSVLAWTGTNEASRKTGKEIGIYKSTWQNPWPEIEIASINYLSFETSSCPFLLAITVE